MSDERKMTREEWHQHYLTLRHVHNPCEVCDGTGERLYGSTAVWMGGLGGSMMTHGICDKCWGSGDDERPWLDLRKIKKTSHKEFHAELMTLIGTGNHGADNYYEEGMHEAYNAITDWIPVIEKLADKYAPPKETVNDTTP